MDKPLNVDDVETVSLESGATDDAAWVGGYFAYGGSGSEQSTRDLLSRSRPARGSASHYDTAEETQFFIGGSGELLLDDGPQPVKKGDLIVLTEGTMHDLKNTGDEDLRVIGFFAKPQVEQHWSEETWGDDNESVTGSPNR